MNPLETVMYEINEHRKELVVMSMDDKTTRLHKQVIQLILLAANLFDEVNHTIRMFDVIRGGKGSPLS